MTAKCACYTPKGMAKFKEQPKQVQCYCCCNPRRNPWNSGVEKLTIQERKFWEHYNA